MLRGIYPNLRMENYSQEQNPTFSWKGAPQLPWSPASLSVVALTLLSAAVIFTQGTVFMMAATLAYGSLVLGLVWRKHRQIHPVVMLTGIVIDVSIVLILEVQRNAIDTALSFRLSPMQQAHIGCSTTALLLYFPTVFMGWKLWKGNSTPRLRQWHINVAVVAFCFRTLGFLLMLSFVGSPVKH